MIKIYGAAHQMRSGGLLDYDGLVTQQDICDLLKGPLTWNNIGLDESECNWLIVAGKREYHCDTNEDFQKILTKLLNKGEER